MVKYSAIIPILVGDKYDNIILIHKLKPKHKIGLLDIPGGPVLNKQLPSYAAIGYLMSETGIGSDYLCSNMLSVGVQVSANNEWSIDFFTALIDIEINEIRKKNHSGESILILDVNDALNHGALWSDLRHIIPIALDKLNSFT